MTRLDILVRIFENLVKDKEQAEKMALAVEGRYFGIRVSTDSAPINMNRL